MEKRERFSPPAVGGTSLLAIFAVLALTVFALLSLSTVQAEKRLADASTQAVTAYYEADAEAEEIFARLRNGETCGNVRQDGDVFSYSCVISERQRLWVELRRTDGEWIVLRWQAVAGAEPLTDETLPVWDGDKERF